MSNQYTRPTQRQLKQDRRKEEQRRREQERVQAEQRKRMTTISIIAVVALLLVGSVTYFVYAYAHGSNAQNKTSNGSNVPSYCQNPANPSYPCVDNIACDQQEHTAFHIHALLDIYINGQKVPVAQNVSIASDQSCLYWLHTHDTTGVIHIEAPANHSFTLGNFLDIWGTQFPQLNYPTRLDVPDGWKAYVNGQPYTGNFRNIPLQAHAIITLAYNSPAIQPRTTYNWGTL